MACRTEFDFDLMARLARESPTEFARRREELLLAAIESFRVPEQGRRAQFAIDAERMATAPGAETCVAIARRLGGLLVEMSRLLKDMQAVAKRGSNVIQS